MTYRVLIGCGNDKTGASYAPGDVVTTADFPERVIADWLSMSPPVVALLEEVIE
jgi:hypothetical protein